MALIIFQTLLTLSVGVSVVLALFALRRHLVPGALSFALMAAFQGLWAFGYIFELQATTLNAKIIWDNVQFLAVDGTALAILAFVLVYSGRNALLNRVWWLLCIPLVINTILVWTDPLHLLIRKDPSINVAGAFPVLIYSYGEAMWASIAYNYTLVLVALALGVRELRYGQRFYRRRTYMLQLGLLLPLLGSLLTVLDLVPLPGMPQLDITPVVFAFSSPLIAWVVFRSQLLDLVPVARGLLIEQMSDGVLVVDEQRRVVDCNPSAQRIFGCSAQQLIGLAVDTLVPELAVGLSVEHRQDCTATLSLPTGLLTLDLVVTPLARGQRPAGWLVVLRDVTAARQNEVMLRRNEEWLRATGRIAQVGGWEMDLRSRHLHFSDESYAVLGAAPGSLRDAHTVLRLIDDTNTRTQIYNVSREATYAGRDWDIEVPFTREDGQQVWLRVQGRTVRDGDRPMFLRGTIQDVTDRKRAEQQLERQLRETLVLNRVIAAVASTLEPEQVLETVCRELAQAFGLPQAAAALLNSDGTALQVVAEYLEPGRPPAMGMSVPLNGSPATQQVIDERRPLYIRNAQNDPRQTSIHGIEAVRGVVSLLIVPIIVRDTVIGTIGLDALSVRPFSPEEIELAFSASKAASQALEKARIYIALQAELAERTRTEAALEKAKTAAESADRAKSEFLANMSHEIRTPLNAVIGMSSLLLNTALDPAQRSYVETVRTSGDMLLSVINDILDFSKIEAGRLELEQQPFHLSCWVDETVELVALVAAQQQLDLIVQIDPTVPDHVVGDATRLRQVLLNLLSNAVKFTEHGEVVLTVDLAGSSTTSPALLTVQVADTGIGIPADRLDRLFLPFSQVDASTTRKYGGTGLGLAISRRLVTLMGGTLEASSVPGAGSTFSFTVPLQVIAPAAPAEMDSRPVAGRRALLIDDNATSRKQIATMLESWHMVVQPCQNLTDALAWLDGGGQAEVVLLDTGLATPTGSGLTEQLRNHLLGTNIPLVALEPGPNLAQAEGLPAVAVVVKRPVRPARLLPALVQVLARESVELPAAPVAERAMVAAPSPLRVLVAEDNPVNQRVMQAMLGRLGYHAEIVPNGREALAAVEQHVYDVVLMDVQMPEMDGVTATRLIRARGSAIAQPCIIALTANVMQGDRESYLAAGMNDYLSKPLRLELLREALERVQPLESVVAVVPSA
ncbi:MAG: response regulator [Chloroflexaceae bacterium]|nr:response regulator [Chloroflexaceae bacterium]